MKIFKELNKLGYKHYTEHTVEELDDLSLDSEKRIMEQALVLRWFRKKYDLEGFVTPLFRSKLNISFENRKYDANIINGSERFHKKGFDTYEEAELDCLKKLIEIVKNK